MIREIAPRVYVETGFHGANVGFIVTDEGVLLIDTPLLPDDARLWLTEIRRRTEQEITFIVNTDHHWGHILGNQYFPTAKVIAHEFAWKNMKGYKVLFAGDLVITDRPPFLSQSDTKKWLRSLTYLRKLRYDVLVPGHGELCGKEATERMSEFLRLVRRRVRSAYRSGMSKTDTARTLQSLISEWPIPPFEKPKAARRFKSSLTRVWNEMRAEAAAKAKAR